MSRSTVNWVLAVGYLAVAVAVVVARYEPATGYEASIYAATPAGTWVTVGLALAIAVGATLSTRGIQQAIAIALGGLAVTAVVSLPLVRGYRFYGKGDALTHLGWVRDIVQGELLPHELFYPALHSISAIFHLVGGIPEEQAVMLAVVVLFLPFVIFVPLVVRQVTGNPTAVGFAAIVAWFVLPINNVATHMGAHVNSNALFFVPVVIFAIVAYLGRRPRFERLPLLGSPYGLLVILTGATLLLIHPQQMINVVIVLGAISVVQFLLRRRTTSRPVLEQPTTYGHTFVLGGLFLIWAVSNARFREAFSGLVYGLVTTGIGGGAEVDQRGASLAEIGGSLTELFVKMFFVSALVAVVVGLFLLVVWFGWSRMDAECRSYVTYLGVSLFPLGGVFLVYFLGTPTMAFRQLGFIYVVLTILGGVALGGGVEWLRGLVTTPGANALAAIAVGACLVLALVTLFGSPIIYSPTQHVSDQQYGGYETAFEHGDDRPYAGYGYGTYRYSDALYGVESIGEQPSVVGPGDGVVDPDAFDEGDYTGAYPGDDYYLVVTEFDTTREFEIYQQLNHDRVALEELESHRGTNKHVSNDEFRLYGVSNRE